MSRTADRLKIKTDAEEFIRPVYNALSPLHRRIFYKALYAEGIRIATVDAEISREIDKLAGK